MKTSTKHSRPLSPPRRSSAPALGAACLLTTLSLAACSGDGAGSPTPAERGQAVIGGFPAGSPALDHFGALVAIDPTTGEPFEFCSGTLIGPETVVTAKHCAVVLPDAQFQGFEVAWATGADATAPTELIPIAAVDTAPGDVGGFVGVGRDAAVVHLDRPSGIPPATPQPFTDDLIGAAMVSVGYGVHGASGQFDDHRRIGRETVAATEGRALELMLGDFESFVEWAFTGQVTPEDFLATFPPDDPTLDFLRLQFDALVLFDGHEAVTGLEPSDTQTCSGDSGGPLARFTRAAGWETFGVVSGGLNSLRSACDFGSVFATFGPVTFAFIERSLDWVDPCEDVGASGTCDGSVAVRCETNFIGNIRRRVTVDCSEQGLECVSSETGTGCGEIPPSEPSEPPDAEARQLVLDAVRQASRPLVARGLTWSD